MFTILHTISKMYIKYIKYIQTSIYHDPSQISQNCRISNETRNDDERKKKKKKKILSSPVRIRESLGRDRAERYEGEITTLDRWRALVSCCRGNLIRGRWIDATRREDRKGRRWIRTWRKRRRPGSTMRARL